LTDIASGRRNLALLFGSPFIIDHLERLIKQENVSLSLKFLSRLIMDVERKVFLILDNHRVHHSKIVTKWLDAHKEKIEVFNLPPYAPEYNPDEYLNGDLKKRIRKCYA
jgi:hypothetical protein